MEKTYENVNSFFNFASPSEAKGHFWREKSFFIKVATLNFDRISDHQGQVAKVFFGIIAML